MSLFEPAPLPSKGPETPLSSQTVFEGSVLRIRQDWVRLENGVERPRDIVEHPGGVMVIPILPDGRLLLIRQYRYALDDTIYEFPAGKCEPGEDRLMTVQRELEEETGYRAQQWEELLTITTAPGFCDEWITLYKAMDLIQLEQPRREEDEFIELVPVTVSTMAEWIAQKRIVDAKTLCGFALLSGLG